MGLNVQISNPVTPCACGKYGIYRDHEHLVIGGGCGYDEPLSVHTRQTCYPDQFTDEILLNTKGEFLGVKYRTNASPEESG